MDLLIVEPLEAEVLQWLFWLTNTLQEDLQHWWHADNYLDTDAARHDGAQGA